MSQGLSSQEIASNSIQLDEASPTITYVGYAAPGTLTSDPEWQIKRLDSTSGLIVLYADADNSFSKIWDDRAMYTYL